eukprot:CAMPEP_0183347382 /NCGR_PEP_ID=MMETSP0164_2-20130417/12218_1 /TAXON_ID=221442 /ORGANISM="Coccolithus pelagicus ssp braarudi, Strain PLY182g" /LENGTH=71 /DNA_ID=CAMNT_0025518791 /DNA_START=237 /DNA_END=448 /DNA_ORIENTATION=+
MHRGGKAPLLEFDPAESTLANSQRRHIGCQLFVEPLKASKVHRHCSWFPTAAAATSATAAAATSATASTSA